MYIGTVIFLVCLGGIFYAFFKRSEVILEYSLVVAVIYFCFYSGLRFIFLIKKDADRDPLFINIPQERIDKIERVIIGSVLIFLGILLPLLIFRVIPNPIFPFFK